jgi:hypothetical protein
MLSKNEQVDAQYEKVQHLLMKVGASTLSMMMESGGGPTVVQLLRTRFGPMEKINFLCK